MIKALTDNFDIIKSREYRINKNSLNAHNSNRNAGENNQSLTKALAQASKSSAVAGMNIARNISFKGKKITEVPRDWRMTESEITDNGGVNRNVPPDHEASFYKPNPEEINDFINDTKNRNTCLDFYHATTNYHSMYSYPVSKTAEHTGALFIDEKGALTYYSKEEMGIKDDISSAELIFSGLKKDGRINEAGIVAEKYALNSPEAQSAIAAHYIIDGREDEAAEKYPHLADSINKTVDDIKGRYFISEGRKSKQERIRDLLAEGRLKEAVEEGVEYLPSPLNEQKKENLLKAAEYIDDNNLLEIWADQYREYKKSTAEGFLDDKNEDDRTAYALITLGLSEALNLVSKQFDKLKQISSANKEIAVRRELVNACVLTMLNAMEDKTEDNRLKSFEIYRLEELKEPARAKINSRLIKPLIAYAKDNFVKIPNCVMLTGDNPFVMKELIDWTGELAIEEANTDYIKLPSLGDKALMQESILAALENAEENYQTTGKRSLIFVNGMEKLINSYSNTKADIAVMKDLMDKAGRYFHSTLIFYAKNPENLDPGTAVAHRIGLKVDVPAKFDSNIKII